MRKIGVFTDSNPEVPRYRATGPEIRRGITAACDAWNSEITISCRPSSALSLICASAVSGF